MNFALPWNRAARNLAVVLVAALLVTLLSSVAVSTPAAARQSSESTLANEVATQINRERAARGLPALARINDGLAQGAADYLQAIDTLGHFFDLTQYGQAAGEDVFRSSNLRSSAATRAFMGSTGHRNILLSQRYDTMAVGVACNGDGSGFVVVHFVASNASVGARQSAATSSSPVATPAGSGSTCTSPVAASAPAPAPQPVIRITPPPAAPAPAPAPAPRPVGSNPTGALDQVTLRPDGVEISGWAYDRDSGAALEIHAYVDGRLTSLTSANLRRSDVAAAYGIRQTTGYSRFVPVAPGTHQVCVFALNRGGGSNVQLGCSTVTIAANNPMGNIEGATRVGSSLSVRGWALDADTTAPIAIHVYVGGWLASAKSAGTYRPDVAQAFGLGAYHGFDLAGIPISGTQQVCIYGINYGGGTHTLLGCFWA